MKTFKMWSCDRGLQAGFLSAGFEEGESPDVLLCQMPYTGSEEARDRAVNALRDAKDDLSPKVVLVSLPNSFYRSEAYFDMTFIGDVYTRKEMYDLVRIEHNVPQSGKTRMYLMSKGDMGLSQSEVFQYDATTALHPLLRDALFGLPEEDSWWPGMCDTMCSYNHEARGEFVEWVFDAPSTDGHVARGLNDMDREDFERIREGESGKEAADRGEKMNFNLSPGGFTDRYYRLDRHKPCRAVSPHIQKNGSRFIHPWKNRSLTPREIARVQTFPDSHRISDMSMGAAYRLLGGATPPLLAYRLAMKIKEAI